MKVVQSNVKAITERLRKLSRTEIAVGYPGQATDSSTQAGLAAIHEFGLGDMPPRPFVLPGVASGAEQYKHFLRAAASAAMQDQDFEPALKQCGLLAQNNVKKYVLAQPGEWAARNAKYNARQVAKGKTKTLIDSGAMLNAVHFVVRETDGTN